MRTCTGASLCSTRSLATENIVAEIVGKKTRSNKGGTLDPVNDFILWYGKNAKPKPNKDPFTL